MCINPISIKVEQNNPNSPPFHMVQVPCGKCPICVNKYQNSWTIRIIEEFKNWKCSTFLTLTYREDTVPFSVQQSTGLAYRTVYKKHIQDWLKRFRTRYKREYSKDALFKYYCCSEYGPLSQRPHYHLIIFGLSPQDLHLAISDWRKLFGYVSAKPIDLLSSKSRTNSARYVGKYCLKGDFENLHSKLKHVNPTFRLMSKGLGSSYVFKHRERILNMSLGGPKYDDINDKLIYSNNGFTYSLPRYFKDKLLPPKSLIRYKTQAAALSRADEVYLQKLRELSTTMSEAQATNYLAMQEVNANRQRADEIALRQNEFYKKSQI